MRLMLSALPFLASLALTTGASANDDHRGEVRSVRAIAKISACDAAATGPISGVARLIERPSAEGRFIHQRDDGGGGITPPAADADGARRPERPSARGRIRK